MTNKEICKKLTIYFTFNYGQFSLLGFFMILNTFMTGVVLIGLGLIALYIANIHAEVINRPLYIVRSIIKNGNMESPDVEK